MRSNETGLRQSYETDTSPRYRFFEFIDKPLEIYVFIDPLCPECWSFEPYLKKLMMEYGHYFTIRPILSDHLKWSHHNGEPKKIKAIWERTANRTGMSCDGDLWLENPVSSPWIASLAIKAAELQGKKYGRIYLRKIQENAFLKKRNIAEKNVLLDCAKDAQLDMEEFERDLYSSPARKAYQRDRKLTDEMEIDYIPSLVVFNQNIEEHGIKISGLYPYNIYERMLKQMLQTKPKSAKKPALEEFLSEYGMVGNKEIAVVYDWSNEKTNGEMKKLQLQQSVKKVPAKHGTFWKYIK